MKKAEELLNGMIPQGEMYRKEGDYIGEDGLLYCGICHERKQYPLKVDDAVIPVRALCRCEIQQRNEMEAEERRKRKEAYIQRLRKQGIQDRALLDDTFDHDDGSLPILRSARRYVNTWPKRKANNDGLLLWGEVGTGKTFFAACIANALIDQGVPVMMTNFAKILNRLSGLYSNDKNEFINELMDYELLIIDDLGIERNTDFALEQIYTVIDERYKTRLPLIITTNLSLETMKHPEDLAHYRIYDRIFSMCIPVSFLGITHRKRESEIKMRSCRELFE